MLIHCVSDGVHFRDTWVRILSKTTSTFLVLMPFSPTWSEQYPATDFQENMKELFKQYGVSETRIRVLNAFPNRKDLQQALKIGDIYLDSYPYSGTTSLLDPLECNLPIVTRFGKTLRGRMGASMLKSLSLDDLVVENTEEYIDLAIKLAQQSNVRQKYRQLIEQKMSAHPQFLDSHRFSNDTGKLLEELFHKWQKKHG